MFLLLFSITWPNFITWFSLLCELLGNVCIVIVCWPGCDVINFEINFIFLNLCLPGDTSVTELQYSSFHSAVTFLKYFTYVIISNKLVKFNIGIKFNIFSVFDLLKVASITEDFHFSNGDASFINN